MWASAPTGGTAFLTEGKDTVKGVKAPADAQKPEIAASGVRPPRNDKAKVGWDGRVVAKEATGPSVTVDGKKYEFLGYDEKGSPVYQDAQVLREQEVSEREKEQQEDPQQKSVVNPTNSDTMKLPDIQIGRSLGAKAKNYQVMDLSTGEMFNLVEGTNLQNVEAFAGKGTKTQYRNAYKYADAYGGKIEDWQHVKGNGWIAYTDGDRYAEIHWSQCEGIGKYDLFIKRWKDES